MNTNSTLDTNDVEATLTEKLHRVGRLLRARANACLKAKGIPLSAEQWGILVRLSETEGRHQGTLANRTLQDYPNITRLVDKLEKRNLVRRRVDPQDRRSHLLYLTKGGKALVEKYLVEVIEEKSKFYVGLDAHDIATLSGLLSIIEANLIGRE